MPRRSPSPTLLLPLVLAAALAGCDQLGIESASATAEKKEAEGKAIGSACRHANRAIEDCYTLYPKSQKAAVYAGWREMDEYMRENKLEGIAPVIPRPVPGAAAASAAAAAAAAAASQAEAADETDAEDKHGGAKGDKAAHGAKSKAKAEH